MWWMLSVSILSVSWNSIKTYSLNRNLPYGSLSRNVPSVRDGYRAVSFWSYSRCSHTIPVIKSNTVVIDQCIIHKSFCNIFAQLLFQMEIVFFTYFYPKFNELYVLLHKQLARYWSEANPYFSITTDIQHNTECPHTWASNIVLKRCSSIPSFMVIVEDFYQWTTFVLIYESSLGATINEVGLSVMKDSPVLL